jgi:hypothetical protein
VSLADLIIELGPFSAGDVIPPALLRLTAVGMNELRDELIELRAIVAKVEDEQCGCLGGPFSIEWVRGEGPDGSVQIPQEDV